MVEDFKSVTGTIKMLGNSIVTRQAQNYSIIEIEDVNGKMLALQNVAVGNILDNYLRLGEKLEIKLVKAKIFSKLFGDAVYVYGVRREGGAIVSHIPSTFSSKRNLNIFLGLLCFAGGVTIPLGIYFLWRAIKQSKVLGQMKVETAA
ncbi:hypothetical protein [Undibacterium fentianense]|uniref:Uncharacterized protein n=1 Tax=Undibacterium fentianense TaxID=2828728 RepID=A0A941E1N2_9BURK|nr:hypothetical protein [Undibacterium fentianense]MBR7799004.1 hypothetical protein [Undibacterium fentianense]